MTAMLDPWDAAIAQMEAPDYQRDVYRWSRDRFDIYMWSLPQRIAELTQTGKRTAVPACHDSSKSHTAALLACHHVDQNPIGDARVITTAPSGAQVTGVLWSEMNKMFELAKEKGTPLPGKMNQQDWWIGKWQAGIGRKPNDYKPEQFAGFHALKPFIILDEADGLPPEMWDGVEALMTNKLAKMLAIGNPIDPMSRFAKVIELAELAPDDSEWAIVRIPYHATPNFTAELARIPEPHRTLLQNILLDPDWVEARRKEWGGRRALDDPNFQPDHPFWYGRVLAVHPPEAMHVIIGVYDVAACREPNNEEPTGVRQLGIDVAGSEKGDVTVCRERVGRHVMRKWTLQSGDDDEIIDFMVDCTKQMQAEIVALDATGMGIFVPGRLRAKLPGVAILPVNFASSATEHHDDKSRKYENMRAQLWVRGRDMSRDRLWDLSKAEDADTLEFELVAARYLPDKLSKKRVWQVESKDEIRKRIGRSPDDADATLLAFHRAKGAGRATVSSARAYSVPIGAASVVRR